MLHYRKYLCLKNRTVIVRIPTANMTFLICGLNYTVSQKNVTLFIFVISLSNFVRFC